MTDGYTVEKVGNVVTCALEDKEAFFEGELPKKQIKEVFDHANAYIQKHTAKAAEMATKLMKDDPKVDEVLVTAPYGVSARGNIVTKAVRSVTFRGMNGGDPVTRSDLKTIVTDPLTSMSKTSIKKLRATMSETLLG